MLWRQGEQLLFLGGESCPSSWSLSEVRVEVTCGAERPVFQEGPCHQWGHTTRILQGIQAPLMPCHEAQSWAPPSRGTDYLLETNLWLILWYFLSFYFWIYVLGLMFFVLLSLCHWTMQPTWSQISWNRFYVDSCSCFVLNSVFMCQSLRVTYTKNINCT